MTQQQQHDEPMPERARQQANTYKQTMQQMSTYAAKFIEQKTYGMIEDEDFCRPTRVTDEGIHQANTKKRKTINDVHDMFTDIQKRLIKIHKKLQITQKLTYRESSMKHRLKQIQTVNRQKKKERKAYAHEQLKRAANAATEAAHATNINQPIDKENDYWNDETDFR